jgi:nicotinamidase-related amidase
MKTMTLKTKASTKTALLGATFAALMAATLISVPTISLAQSAPSRTAPQENVGPAPTLTPGNTVLLLIDHQVGLSQLVRDQTPDEFRNNVLGLARAAKAMGIPVILSTSRDWGPNGPIFPELRAMFPDAPIIRRTGIINAYRDPAFRRAVEATGRKNVVIAAISASTCLQFPALDMVRDGYTVHGVIDASGSVSETEREVTIATLAANKVTPRNWFSVLAELRADWRRDEAAGWPVASTLTETLPVYGWLMTQTFTPEKPPTQ